MVRPVLQEMEPEIKMDVAEDDKAYTVRAEIKKKGDYEFHYSHRLPSDQFRQRL